MAGINLYQGEDCTGYQQYINFDHEQAQLIKGHEVESIRVWPGSAWRLWNPEGQAFDAQGIDFLDEYYPRQEIMDCINLPKEMRNNVKEFQNALI